MISDFFEQHYRPLCLLGCRPNTLAEYRSCIRRWQKLTKQDSLDSCTTENLARLAEVMLAQKLSPATVNKVTRHLLPILRHAVDSGLIAKLPHWKKLREPTRCPRAFTQEEFLRLLTAAKVESGTIGGIPACFWWESLLRSNWFSGARIGALLAVPICDVLLNQGGFYVRAEAQKQNADQFFRVDLQTVDSWRRIWSPDRLLMWETDCCRHTLYRRFHRIIKRAGCDGPTRKRFHRIRCSTASYLKRNGGNPTEQLGHSTPTVTRAYYDPRITGESSILQFMPSIG